MLARRRFILLLMIILSVFWTGTAHAATYKVQSGDSLYLISQKHGVSVDAIKTGNGLSSTVIYPGQTLWVPTRGTATYTVRSGDSLYKIGQRFGLTANQILGANNLSSSTIYVGQTLYIPSGNVPTTASRGAEATRDTPAYSQNDLSLLAHLVYGEARGEPYVGQVAAAAVVLNRVKDPRFPNTVAGVIYQPWAFSAINDGQFYLSPNNTAYQAARDALNGWDPSGGALYFWNPGKTSNTWIWSRPVLKTIGNHVFAI